MNAKDGRARIFLCRGKRNDCLVDVRIVECSYDPQKAVPGVVMCCQAELIPEVIQALRQALKRAKKEQAELEEDAGHSST